MFVVVVFSSVLHDRIAMVEYYLILVLRMIHVELQERDDNAGGGERGNPHANKQEPERKQWKRNKNI